MSHGADVDDGLLSGIEIEVAVQFLWAVEVWIGQKDSGEMGVSDKAKGVDSFKEAGELVDI